MNGRCEDIADALAAYALDALPEVERHALTEHLAECRAHDEELAAYRAVAGRLPLLADAATPPPALRLSLLGAFDRELAPAAVPEVATAPAAQAEPEPASEPVRPRGGLLSIFRQPAFAYGIAAALLFAIAGLGAWNLSLQDDGEHMLHATGAAPGMSLDVEYDEDRRIAVLDMDMPPPSAGHVYQAWLVMDGKMVNLGLVDSSQRRVAFAVDMTGASAIAVSMEPAGGSATPSNVKIKAEF